MSELNPLLIQSIKDVTIVDFNQRQIRDMHVIQEIGEELFGLVDQRDVRKLVLDFSKVQLLSSAMLGVLLNLKTRTETAKGRVVICCLRRELRDVFRLARLDKMFSFYDSEEDALASFGVTSGG